MQRLRRIGSRGRLAAAIEMPVDPCAKLAGSRHRRAIEQAHHPRIRAEPGKHVIEQEFVWTGWCFFGHSVGVGEEELFGRRRDVRDGKVTDSKAAAGRANRSQQDEASNKAEARQRCSAAQLPRQPKSAKSCRSRQHGRGGHIHNLLNSLRLARRHGCMRSSQSLPAG